MFEHVSIDLDNGNTLDIVAPGNSESTPYVCSVVFNGRALKDGTIDYFDLRKGGQLVFTMSDKAC